MATSASQASQTWHSALKLRKHLSKQLEKIQADSASGVDIAQFEAVDSVLEKFRLACVSTIFLDFDYAVAENTENILWGLHTSINAEYRRLSGRLKNSSHAVEKRKVEKMYNNFLRIAQKFYKGYIQRLAARYDVQELKRVAQGLEVDQVPAGDSISPVPADLNAKVVKSCHATLIRLGDLARYRVQAKHKRSGYDMALTFYSLAHDLIPDSGFGFHQIGIINLDQGEHLDVVYHFYRSWAVADPHPNARSNLEAEFKSMQLSNAPTARNRPAALHDALAMWFVRLHALFYKGDISPKHEELEGEVLHRLEMAAKSATSSDVLLKMALVNMSAYYIASVRFAEKRDSNASRFCQYALRFNVRFVLTLCGVVESDLKEHLNQRREGAVDQNATSPPKTVGLLLPVLRAYTSWLAAHRHEIFKAVTAVGNSVFDMVQSLANAFTLLCAETYNQDNLSSCPYLLPEDLAMRGLRALSEEQVPEACRYQCKEDGSLKPHLQSQKQQLSPHQESSARILDILRGAYYLAEDPSVPLGYRVLGNWLVFEYQPNPQKQAAASNTASAPINESQQRQKQDQDSLRAAPKETAPKTGQQAKRPGQSGTSPLGDINGQANGDIDDAEKTVIEMLTPFLRPPSPQQHPRSPEESSYGMHTATANEVFGALGTESSSNGSVPPSRKLEPLPWNWVYTPTPHKTQDPGREAFSGHRRSGHSSKGSMSGMMHPEDPFAGQGSYHVARADHEAAAQGLGSPSSEAVHKNHLLQSFSNPDAPRTSSFTAWSAGDFNNGNAQAQPAWAGTGGSAENAPLSTEGSNFSQLSSLYHGTPAEFGAPHATGFAGGHDPRQPSQGGQGARQFRMDETTSSYDAAILHAAYYGSR